jgi:hypothetical protein
MTIDPPARLKIIALENEKAYETVIAQFNPKEVSLENTVPWAKAAKKVGAADLEYSGGAPMAMSFELLFDTFESNTSVVPMVQALQKMTRPMKDKGDLARPPKVKVIWGKENVSYNLPTFTAVFESVSVKYQMFSPDGQVVRATVNVKLKEAGDLSVGRPPR